MTAALALLQLWVAPLLAVALTLWAAIVALAAHDDDGVPRLLGPGGETESGPLTPARGLHLVHLALLACAAALAATALGWWAWPPGAATLRLSLAILLVWVVGDLVPRIWAANEPGLVRFDGAIARHTLALFRPVLALVALVDRRERRVAGAPGRVGGRSRARERERLSGVFALAGTTAAEVMTPRLDIVSVDFSSTRTQVVETFRRYEHSRLLVVDGDPDSIVGVLYAKDLLPGLCVGADEEWHHLIRPVEYVPEGKTLDRQLRDFQRGAGHLAVVVDEFGGTSGLVTLEDVLEQIVGEIQDEYDTEEVAPVQRTPGGGWAVQGGVPLGELEAELNHHFGREHVSTVGGLVLDLFGRVPRPGEIIELDGYRLTVDQVVRRRVRRVTVARSASPAREGVTQETSA